jgi:tetratricopeptide (TPR) repeat protein/DNA-binding XRE family transcriptional regulator
MSAARRATVGQRLRQERERRSWSQHMLAAKIGTSVLTINRWEHDKTLPQPFYREKLCSVLSLSAEELFSERPDVAAPCPLGGIPYLRNLYFTGREEVLTALRNALTRQGATAPTWRQAISGLGGIGKTQLAIEYAYRYADTYEALFWVRADSHDVLVSDFLTIAAALNLFERNQQDQHKIVQAVKRWFATHRQWLLIFDNADQLDLVREFLPADGNGHVILTTRAQATGTIAEQVNLDNMSLEEGMLFLLRRMKLLKGDVSLETVSEAIRASAQAIVETVDGLPLAIDQAGAYIEETECSLTDYLTFYQTHRDRLLLRRGRDAVGHPEPVATTWSLSFERVRQVNPAAAELLHLCAFFHPDAISETMLAAGAPELGSVLQPIAEEKMELNDAIRELLTYSLIRRDASRMSLSMHRLVQATLRDGMEQEVQRAWARRVVRALWRAFPEALEISAWPTCQEYLPHALVAASLIDQGNLWFPEAVSLLERVGKYLEVRAQYDEAERCYQQALRIRKKLSGDRHPEIGISLNHLALLYTRQGKYQQAQPLFEQALALYKQASLSASPVFAQTLYGLAWLSHDQGKYQQAEQLYQQALLMGEQVFGSGHHEVAETLNRLAWLSHDQGKLQQAEQLYQRALMMLEHSLGGDHPKVAECLNNLALLAWDQGDYDRADLLYQRALAITRQAMGSEHPQVALTLNNLGLLHWKQHHYEQAEAFYVQALTLWEKALGPNHADVATCLNNLGRLYQDQGSYDEAELFHRRALAIREQELGANHPDVAFSLNNLALLAQSQKHYDQAETYFRRALAIRESTLGLDHPLVAATLTNFANLYCNLGNYNEAELLYQRALTIQEQVLDAQHPDLAKTLESYAALLQQMGKLHEGQLLAKRVFLRKTKERPGDTVESV